MKLLAIKTEDGKKEFEKKGYVLPKFNREALKKETYAHPTWVHFGAGNIFRAYQTDVLEKILDRGLYNRGIIVAEGFDYEIIDKAYRPYDNLALSVVMHSDGSIEKNVIGSITESLKCDKQFLEDWTRLVEIFKNPSLQLVTLTITEKGYSFNDADLEAGFDAKLMLGKLTCLLLERFNAGAYPITLQSTDNCSHNGDKVKAGVLAYAKAFEENGLAPFGFYSYVSDEQKVSYPWSMIDKITPRPDARIREMLMADDFEDVELIETEKHSFTAPFVNSEEVGYLVMEDHNPNGRPPLEKGGVLFADKETVDKIERMKVGTCLNPLHTAMSIYGCMLGYTLISAEMADEDIKNFILGIGYKEGMPVVVHPGVIDPLKFIDEVVNKRLPNPFMPDAPQRISTDTSQKLPIRFGGTLKAYLKKGMDVSSLTLIPLVYAGYARFLRALDDNGNEMPLSSDPLLPALQPIVAGLELGKANDYSCLKQLFSREDIFGVNLYEVGLGEKVEGMTKELFEGVGAVRKTLHRYVTEKEFTNK